MKYEPNPSTCKHLANPEACPSCAADELDRLLPRIDRAVTAARSTAAREVAVTGGSPSWELVNVQAMSLLQDIDDERPEPAYIGGRATIANVGWRNRALVILGEAFAPQTIMRDAETVTITDADGHTSTIVRARPARCPVIGCKRIGEDGPGLLLLHRFADERDEDQYGKPELIRCNTDSRHEWTYRHGGFLRLKVALTTIGAATA